MFENARIKARIKQGLDRVPAYVWTIKPNETAEVAEIVFNAVKDSWGAVKHETITMKAIYALALAARFWKEKDRSSYLAFNLAAQSIAATIDEMNLLVGLMGLPD